MFDPVARLLELTGPRPHVAVAFSGGIDSTVLAHALAKRRRRLGSLRLLHVDHGLQAASHDWSRHCARVARSLGVPFVSLEATIRRKRGESPEAAARDARYALLEMVLEPGEVLVTAQHRDDQVETLLLQLFRGAGVAGLAAMPVLAKFGAGQICRPLLSTTREEIESYARRHRLRWIEDPTNMETQFARNFLRVKVLPIIRQQWHGVDAAIARSANHMAESARVLHGLGRTDYERVADGEGVNVAALRALPEARRRNALRAYIAKFMIEAPSTAQMMEIAGSLLTARPDAQPEIAWHGAVMRRRGGRLLLEVKSQDPIFARLDLAAKSWDWNSDRVCVLSRSGDRLELIDDEAGPIDLDLLPKLLEIRARSGGETLRPGPRARTQALKKLIQAAKMSVEERAQLPLMFSGDCPRDRLIAAGDRWIDASITANDKSRRRARLIWTRAR
ncbi:MAG TPA: tRNA lysidine(34) synthetase TilS [Steroidobacteraceae bacterium]